jgi:hypothetical protein
MTIKSINDPLPRLWASNWATFNNLKFEFQNHPQF